MQTFKEIHKMTAQTIGKVPHILVIDDEDGVRKTVRLYLEQAGYRASTVDSAEGAWRLLGKDGPDVILTDVMMPGEDGLSFLAKVHQRLPDVPVVIMTGYAHLQIAVDAIKNGAFDFIHKPFDFSYLRQVVGKAIEYSSLRRMEKCYRAELEETVALRTNELKNALMQLDTARESLLKAAREKNEFMTTITHEMRTPMNGVVGALDLLADADLSGTAGEYVLLAKEAAGNMVTLVNQLLSFSGRTDSDPAFCRETINLPDALEMVARDYHPRFAGKGIAFDVRIAPETPCGVRCGNKQVTQLLDILLGNALKFTDRGGVCLDVSPERIDGRRADIRFSVKDSGIGIPAHMLERIFDPFVQVDGSLTRRFGGTGLGLSIARQIAQLIGGSIWAESTPGAGSSFHFRLTADLG
jgi:signal transduction histidine kinase